VDDKAELAEALVARMKAADDALHSGDAGPRKALWSAKEPVTVFGPAGSATGPAETQATFDWVASRYTGFESAAWEILSADVSGNLAYVVAIERPPPRRRGREHRRQVGPAERGRPRPAEAGG